MYYIVRGQMKKIKLIEMEFSEINITYADLGKFSVHNRKEYYFSNMFDSILVIWGTMYDFIEVVSNITPYVYKRNRVISILHSIIISSAR